jgi:hypothetical protein
VAADPSNYLTLATDGQIADSGLVLYVASPPALIDNAGEVVFNGALHDPNQVSSSYDLSTVEFAAADGTIRQIARQGTAVPSGSGFFRSVSFRDMNAQGVVAYDGEVVATPTGQGGNFTLYRSDGVGADTLLHAMGTPAPNGNGTFINTHSLTHLNSFGQATFLSALGNTAGGANDNRGIYLARPGFGPVEIVRTGQIAPGGGAQFHGLGTSFAFNDSGQSAFVAQMSDVALPNNNLPSRLYSTESNGAFLEVAREGNVTPDGTATFASPMGAVAMNATGHIVFYSHIGAGGSSSDAIFVTSAAGVPSELIRTGGLISDPVAGATLAFFNEPQIDNVGRIAFRAQVNVGAPYTPVICRADPGGSGAGGYRVSEVARARQALPDGNGTFLDFIASPKISPNRGLVLFGASIANATPGIASEPSGYFLTDGTDTVIVARTDQLLDGLPVFSVNQAYGSSVPASLNDSGQVVFYATVRQKDGYQVSKLVVFTPTLSPRAGFNGDWSNPAGWTLGLAPGPNYPIDLTTSRGGVASGPSASIAVRSITIGTRLSGVQELQLQKGVTLSLSHGLSVLPSGLLSGEGTIAGMLQNAGIVSPGHSPGMLNADAYGQTLTGSLRIEIAGPPDSSRATFDVLNVTGNATLAGTLQIALLNDYVPALGASFDVFDYGSYSGHFDNITGAQFSGDRHFEPIYGAHSLVLIAVPEPNSVIVPLAFLVLTLCRRHILGRRLRST